MGKFWLKIWIWIKIIILAVLALYVLMFVFENRSHETMFWVSPNQIIATTTLTLALCAFGAGVIATLLLRTIFRTIGQIRQVQGRSQDAKAQRELEEMKAKAAMLRAKPPGENIA